VTVRSYTHNGHAVLEVEDNGPGIAAEERDRVFERFYRARPAGGAGSGLGLSIVREIAVGHGARVDLLDPPSGVGLLVRVQFPAAR
jgi:two-component system sensor histidine kinase TctE